MFGNTSFNKPAAGGFGSTALFGGQQPAASNTLFGGTNATTTQASGIFGGTGTTGFGQSTFGGFGQTQTPANTAQTGGGLFGSTGQQPSSLFSTPTTSNAGFGTKTPGNTGFGTSTQSTGLFGSTPAAGTTSLFGNTTTSTASGGLFGASNAATPFNAATGQSGTTLKFNAPTGQDTMLKGGQTTNISTRHQCITAMKEYESKSLEELRTEDYAANRKGPQPGSTTNSLFSAPQTTQPQQQTNFGGVFGQQQQNKPTGFSFGQTNTGTSSTGGSLFTSTQSSGGLFGQAATTKPLFGTATTTTTASTGFGGFGSTPAAGNTLFGPNQNKSLFGQPATTTQNSLFGATQTPASSGFGAFGTTGFGTNTQTAGGLFGTGNKPTAFGQPAASSTGLTFGQTTTSSSSLFGHKPAGQASTGFSFPQNTSTNFANNTSGSLFANKPTGFGQPTASTGLPFGQNSTTSTGLFGSKPIGQATTGFGIGQTNTSTFGIGNTGLGQNPLQTNTLAQQGAANQTNNIKVQQLLMGNGPYGESPLFRNLTEDPAKKEELLKPTNPVAQKAALAAGNQYKVSPRPTAKIKPKPLHALGGGKAQLFDGLEDEETSFGNDTFVPRRSIKKLVIKANDSMSNASFSKQSSHAEQTDLDESQVPTGSPEDNSSAKENGVRFSSRLSTEKEDIGRSSIPKDLGRNIATGLFKNVNESFLNDTISDFNPRNRTTGSLDISKSDSAGDVDTQSQDSEAPPTPHPAGIVLRRHGYYILPTLEELADMLDDNGDCFVEDLVVGRDGYGNVMFPGETNIANMNLDDIVYFRRKEVTIYPEDDNKPPEGEGLNKKAQVTLDCVWPSDKTTREYIKDPARLQDLHYQEKLERATAKIGAKFLDYRPETGSWVFEVKHFSKYGLLDDSDEEEESVDPKKLKLLKQQQQQQLAIQKKQIEQVPGQPKPPLQQAQQQDDGGQGDNQQWSSQGQKQFVPPPVTMETTPRPLFSDEEDFDDLMDEGVPKEMAEIDEMEPPELAPSSHRLANRLGVMAEELQLRKASFFGDDEDDFAPKWKANVEKPTLGLLKSTILERSSEHRDMMEDNQYMPPQSLLATSFSRQPIRQISPVKRAPQLQPGMSVQTPFVMSHPQKPRPMDHILLPHTKTRPVVGTRIKRRIPSLKESQFSGKDHLVMDSALVRSQTFRVGWGRNFALVHLGKPLMDTAGKDEETPKPQKLILLQQKGDAERSRLGTDAQQLALEQIYISSSEQTDSQLDQLNQVVDDHLQLQLQHTELSVENGCPQAVPRPGNHIIPALAACSQQAAKTLAESTDRDLYQQANLVWELCLALWGDLTNLPVDDAPENSYAYNLARQEAVSDWLTKAVAAAVDEDLEFTKSEALGDVCRIFHHLSGHQLAAACSLAQRVGDHRLALLIAQASGSDICRSMVLQQLNMWQQNQMDDFIEEDRLRIYTLLSGHMTWMTSSGIKVNVCENLDWKRALAAHWWYQCPPSATIPEVLGAYNLSHAATEDSYSVPPLPSYLERISTSLVDVPNKQDVCHHLLQLYCDRSHPLHTLLSPTTATANNLDFRLSWQLSQLLQALEYTHLSEYHAAVLCTSYAAQLERMGLYHWAVFVLLHITDNRQREQAIRAVLLRNISLEPEPQAKEYEVFLNRELRVPLSWIHQAKAVLAGQSDLKEEEAWHWLKAQHWNKAHRLVLRHLASVAIVNDDYGDLKSLLCELGSPEVCRNIEDWDKGGRVYLDYITMMETLEQLQQSEPSPYELEKLQTEVSVLSKCITGLECLTATDRLCKAEMAKRTANLMRTLLLMKEEEDISELLVTETSDLPLPEDYALQELHELTRNYLVAIASSS